jgi:hypothetical protein
MYLPTLRSKSLKLQARKFGSLMGSTGKIGAIGIGATLYTFMIEMDIITIHISLHI